MITKGYIIMGSFEIFTNPTHLAITLTALAILFIAVKFSNSDDLNIGKGIWFLMFGLGIEFLSSWLSFKTSEYYAQGVSITLLVAMELLLLLVAMVFLAIAASQILINNLPNLPVVALLTGVGLLAIIYFVFISPDGNMVISMRQIFPIAGFAYISASFWSKSFIRNHGGYLLAALTTGCVTVVLALRLLGFEYFQNESWYVSALTYVSLGMAVLMIKTEWVRKKLDDAKLEIEKYNTRIEEIIKSSPFPIIISRLSDDKLILANNNAVKLFGIEASELDRYRLKDFFADSENRKLLNERLEREREVQDFEILVKTPTGNSPFWLLTSANIIDYNYDIAIYAAFQDITSRKNREALLKNQATRDPLTSLFNRRYFEEEVSKRIALSRMNGTNFSVLMIDADHFKRVNDTYGHKVGDKVLIELASTCERALRDDDIVARYGGEEFVIYLAKVNAEKAKTVADRLRETISKIVVYSEIGEPIHFTVSIGISSSNISDNIDTLIKTADEALYKAKESGRNRCEIFTPDDMKSFNSEEKKEHKDESLNRHPIFDKEETEEISLLDGIAANHILDTQTTIEAVQPQTSPTVTENIPEPILSHPAMTSPFTQQPQPQAQAVPTPQPAPTPAAQPPAQQHPEPTPQVPHPAEVQQPKPVQPAPQPQPQMATPAITQTQRSVPPVAQPQPAQAPRQVPPTQPVPNPTSVPSAPVQQVQQTPPVPQQPVAPVPSAPQTKEKEEEYFPILGIDNEDL